MLWIDPSSRGCVPLSDREFIAILVRVRNLAHDATAFRSRRRPDSQVVQMFVIDEMSYDIFAVVETSQIQSEFSKGAYAQKTRPDSTYVDEGLGLGTSGDFPQFQVIIEVIGRFRTSPSLRWSRG